MTLEVPEGWKYGVVRDDSIYEQHILRGPNGEDYRLTINGLNFWGDAREFISLVQDWITEKTGGSNDTTTVVQP